MAVYDDGSGKVFGINGRPLTADEIQKMKEAASDMTAWGKVLDEITASRGGHIPRDRHEVIVREKILDDVPWNKPDFGIGGR